MVRDPSQLFVTNTLTRFHIAEILEFSRVYCGYKHPNGPRQIECDRLTYDICKRFAAEYGELDKLDGEEAFNDDERELAIRFLEELGYVIDVDNIEQERKEILEWIEMTERTMEVRRGRLAELEKTAKGDEKI